MTRSTSRFNRPVLTLLVALCLSAAPASAEEAVRPGVIDLAGDWRLRASHVAGTDDGTRVEGSIDSVTGDGGWSTVSLPADAAALGVKAGGDTLWLERELNLGADWQQRLAPSGLAILINGATFGGYQLSVGERPIGLWRGAVPGIVKPTARVFEVPLTAVDRAGRLRLQVRWQSRDWVSSRAGTRQGAIGASWLLGDLKRLKAEAELERLRHLNSDLPLLVLALLYAAIGAYHLQLFRRDRRCREYLWFGLTALAVALHTLLFTHWAATISADYPVLRRLYLATGALMIATSIQFLWPFLSQPIGRWLKGYQWSLVALAGLALAVPETLWAPLGEMACRAWGVPFLPAAAIVLTGELRRGNAEAKTIAFGGFAIVAVGMIAVVFQLFGKGSLFPLSAYAFALFAVSMAFSLSNRFSRVHDDLDMLRVQLEDMVDDRAAELSNANRRLRSEISERELAQEAMRMLERAVEQSIDGIMVTDLREKSLFANEAWARLHGLEAFEIFGGGLDLFHSAEQMETVRPALDHVKEQGSWEGEIAHQGKDGEPFPTWTSISLLRDPEAKPVGFVMVARDISERKQASAEKQRIGSRVQEAEKLRSLADLAGGIAHDYNNLLTGVLGNSSLALQELPFGSQARDKLVQIGNAAERAAELTAQLLAYSGAETQILKRTDLDQLMIESRAELLRAAGVYADLEFELGGGIAQGAKGRTSPTIEADAAQVRLAVVNLITHAAAGAASGEVITLMTGTIDADHEYLAGGYLDEDHPPGEYVFLRISTTGTGRAAGTLQGGGDPFASTESSSVKGLGLATVLATVRVHHGTVKVSHHPEGGVTFELLFPAAGGKAVAVPDVTRPRRKWRGSGTVLVVDDEYIMREVSRSILEQRGFEVLATGDGREAIELYRRHQSSIRVTLLDRTMPTMPGEEVLERILAFDPDARIVLMSGYKSDSTVRQLIDQDRADFLPKPFRPEELLEKVRSVID